MTPSFGNLRRAASLAWWAMVVLPFAFLAVVLGFGDVVPRGEGLQDTFFWIAIASSLLQVGLSRVLPAHLSPRAPGPDGVAFARMLVAWALCESAALFPLVAFLVTGDPRLVGLFAVDLFALVLLYPGDAIWERLAPVPASSGVETGAGAARRMVR